MSICYRYYLTNPSSALLLSVKRASYTRYPCADIIETLALSRDTLLEDPNPLLLAPSYHFREALSLLLALSPIVIQLRPAEDPMYPLLRALTAMKKWSAMAQQELLRQWPGDKSPISDVWLALVHKVVSYQPPDPFLDLDRVGKQLLALSYDQVYCLESQRVVSRSLPRRCRHRYIPLVAEDEALYCLTFSLLFGKEYDPELPATIDTNLTGLLNLLSQGRKGSRFYDLDRGREINRPTVEKKRYKQEEKRFASDSSFLYEWVCHALEEPYHTLLRSAIVTLPPVVVTATATSTVVATKTETKTKKTKREKIPNAVRHQVWIRYHNDSLSGRCWCCQGKIGYTNWDCGHIVAVDKGGETVLDNLRPLCTKCNRSMGTTNMDEYIKRYGFHR